MSPFISAELLKKSIHVIKKLHKKIKQAHSGAKLSLHSLNVIIQFIADF